jgi:hypothetical protein
MLFTQTWGFRGLNVIGTEGPRSDHVCQRICNFELSV